MAKRLNFTWALSEDVNNKEEITENKINEQINKLNSMLCELKNKIDNELVNVQIDNSYIIDCNGIYENKDGSIYSHTINNRMNVTISKKGRKSTWNDIYRVINSIQSAKYDFI